MAQGRMLVRRISKNDELADLVKRVDDSMGPQHGAYAALLYTWCIPHLDVEGRMHGDPRLVRADVFPLLEWISVDNVTEYLRHLAAASLVVWYQVGNRRYLFFPGFDASQPGLRKDREPSSTIPAPSQNAGVMPAECRSDAGKLRAEVEEKRSEVEVKQGPETGPGVTSQGSLELKVQDQPPAKPKPSRDDFVAVLNAWTSAWVRIKKPRDGKPPVASDADRGQIANLLRRYSLPEILGYLERFMADNDPFLVKQAHHIAHLTTRIDGYRSTASVAAASKSPPNRPPLVSEYRYGDDEDDK